MSTLADLILGKKKAAGANLRTSSDAALSHSASSHPGLSPAASSSPISLFDKGAALATIAILIIGALCTTFIYRFVATTQARDSSALLQGTARIKAASVRAAFQQLQDSAYSLGANLEQAVAADTSFDTLATGAMTRQKGIVATGWIPIFAKSETLPLTRLQVAANSTVAEQANKLIGTDFAANPAWAKALQLSRDTNAAQLVYVGMGVGDAIVVQAVKESGPDTRLKGYVVFAITLSTLIDDSLKSAAISLAPSAISTSVMDVTDSANVKLLLPTSAVVNGEIRQMDAQSAPLAVFSRPWQIAVSATPEFSRERDSGLLPIILLTGAGITALLVGGLFGTRRYTARSIREAEIKATVIATAVATAEATAKAEAEAEAKIDAKVEAMAGVIAYATAEEIKQTTNATQSAELAVLQEAYKSARETELQEMQSEKMASLGMMVAGVAHEINTPLGFVSSNIEMMLEINQQLGGVLKTQTYLMKQISVWSTLSPAARQAWFQLALDAGKALDEIQRRETLAEANGVVNESLEGLQRISDIVKSLKDFSRVDRALVDAVDLHQCIDSTLLIAQNVVRDKADIVKNYATLPTIQCNPSQINQVILNIVSNAAQAMESRGQIIISTRSDGDGVVLEIADNGKGMTEDVRAQIFQPFFTTKDVGEGTGLGLAICEKIIRSHQGTINVQSMVGEGTTFTIRLPLKAKAA
jgi:signal transduction histidine kinase